MLPHGVYGISSVSSTGPEAVFNSIDSARALPSAPCSLPASPLFDHGGVPCLTHALAPTHRSLGGWCPEYLKHLWIVLSAACLLWNDSTGIHLEAGAQCLDPVASVFLKGDREILSRGSLEFVGLIH